MQEHFDALGQWWIYGLSSISGIVGYSQEFTVTDSWKTHALKVLVRLITSLFAGMVAYALSVALAISPVWQFLMVAMLSWSGIKGLQVISDFMNKRFLSGEPGGGK